MKNNADIYGDYYKPYCNCNDNHNCQTGTKNFYIGNNDNNIKVDCVINDNKNIKICGKVIYKNQSPCANALVMLYKCDLKKDMIFIKKTYTNCEGLYEFELLKRQKGKYIIKVEVCNDDFEYCNTDNCNCHHHHDHHNCYEKQIDLYYQDAYFYNYNCEAKSCDYNECISNTINSYKNNYIRKNRQCNNNCHCH